LFFRHSTAWRIKRINVETSCLKSAVAKRPSNKQQCFETRCTSCPSPLLHKFTSQVVRKDSQSRGVSGCRRTVRHALTVVLLFCDSTVGTWYLSIINLVSILEKSRYVCMYHMHEEKNRTICFRWPLRKYVSCRADQQTHTMGRACISSDF